LKTNSRFPIILLYRSVNALFLEPMTVKKVTFFDHPGVALEIEELGKTPSRLGK
jgi:hypothetical protein